MTNHHPHHTWRHIDSGHSPGPLNMAVDEALLCNFDPETSDPILRIYGWKPAALSLGRFQDTAEVLDLERCRCGSVDIVRRVSGGGVIYHADELTYCIVCTQEQIPSTASVKDSFRVLTGFLIEFYRSLGLDACYAVDTTPGHAKLGARTAFCFAGRESFDILIDGRKIGGNAQRRRKNVIFQHGSIPIINQARHGLQYMKDRSPEHAGNSVSLFDCGVSTDVHSLKTMLVEAFRRHMGVDINVESLSTDEQRMSEEFLATKYATECWNLRGDVK